MALFLTRAGAHGEYEQRFLDEGRIYFNWAELDSDFSDLKELPDFYQLFDNVYPDWAKGKQQNNARQAFQFGKCMAVGDWVCTPSKHNPTIHFGKIISDYKFDRSSKDRFKHYREVEWFAHDIARDNFDQDILYSMGAFLTVCRIQRNSAEERIQEMASNNWKVPRLSTATIHGNSSDSVDEDVLNTGVDLEETAYDQISRLILAKFKGHGLTDLVGSIMKAQGFVVHQPPEGPDYGVDLLASSGSLGFGEPRICVQVKCTDSPVERVVLDQLVGTMQNFNAQHGLLVSWGGFKRSIERERANQFFRVRLWNRDDFIEQLLKNYDKLDEEIRNKLPFKRIWAIAASDDT